MILARLNTPFLEHEAGIGNVGDLATVILDGQVVAVGIAAILEDVEADTQGLGDQAVDPGHGAHAPRAIGVVFEKVKSQSIRPVDARGRNDAEVELRDDLRLGAAERARKGGRVVGVVLRLIRQAQELACWAAVQHLCRRSALITQRIGSSAASSKVCADFPPAQVGNRFDLEAVIGDGRRVAPPFDDQGVSAREPRHLRFAVGRRNRPQHLLAERIDEPPGGVLRRRAIEVELEPLALDQVEAVDVALAAVIGQAAIDGTSSVSFSPVARSSKRKA
jgi:hypothetical protein